MSLTKSRGPAQQLGRIFQKGQSRGWKSKPILPLLWGTTGREDSSAAEKVDLLQVWEEVESRKSKKSAVLHILAPL